MKKTLLVLTVALLLAGCKENTYLEPADAGRDYFPAEVGRFRVYQVIDTAWLNYAATVTRYQTRERLAATYADAASQPVFRVELARRADAAAAWVSDSVFALSVDERRVVFTRGTRRSVELVFPVRDSLKWNLSAYANTTGDTITAETRWYAKTPGRTGQSLNGQPFALPGVPARTFARTLTTANYGPATTNNNCVRRNYRQVFAPGIGPVYRRGFSFNFSDPATGTCDPQLGVFEGRSHTEILLESGP